MADNFGLYAKYYNLLYGDKDYSAEVDYVVRQLRHYVPEAKDILEFGSGSGRHGLLLQKQGYQVFGLERSEAMVAQAREQGLDCMVADISHFELNRSFDAVLALFHVVSYLTSNDALIGAFRMAHQHLNPGGVMMFDVWYSPAVYGQKALPRVKKMQNAELAVTRFAEPVIRENDNVVEVHYTVFARESGEMEVTELAEVHPMRHFGIPEIDLLARLTGFQLLKAEAFMSGNEPSEDTWGVFFVLQKSVG